MHKIQRADRTERRGAETSPTCDQLRILLGAVQLRKMKLRLTLFAWDLLGLQLLAQWRDPQQQHLDSSFAHVHRGAMSWLGLLLIGQGALSWGLSGNTSWGLLGHRALMGVRVLSEIWAEYRIARGSCEGTVGHNSKN